jgi:hypothetical protein
MSCQVDVDTAVKLDILGCSADARRQIGNFLAGLQENPLPAGRQEMQAAAFYVQLPGGYYVSWEIVGNLTALCLDRRDRRAVDSHSGCRTGAARVNSAHERVASVNERAAQCMKWMDS